jgi:hypothetical protein
MRNFPRSLLGAAVAALLAAPSISWSQSADATLRGSAPADTDVTAKNVATGTTRRTKAGADGSYTLAGLPPGTYRVDAGPGTETVVTLSVASTATLDLGASATGTAVESDAPMQEVTVTGRRLNEVRTSEVGATVSSTGVKARRRRKHQRRKLKLAATQDALTGIGCALAGPHETKTIRPAQAGNAR